MHSLNYLTKGRVFIIMVFICCCVSVAENNNQTALKKSATRGSLIIKGFYLGMSGVECANLINSKYFKILFPKGQFEGWQCTCTKDDSCRGIPYYADDLKKDCSKLFDTTNFPKPDAMDTIVDTFTGQKPGCIHTFHYLWNKTFYDKKCHKLIFEYNYYPIINLTFDSANRLISFGFPLGTVNLLFNVSDLPAEDFVHFFINSYKIPEMKDEDNSKWYYISPNGWKLEIEPDKSIYIKYVPKETERKFD